MTVREEQEKIQQMINGNSSELIQFANHPHTYGVGGFKPETYIATAAISGNSVLRNQESERQEYRYLPSFGFEITLGCKIISPFSGDDHRQVFMSSPHMRSGGNKEDATLWLHLPANRSFFDILNAISSGDRFYPYQVEGEEALLTHLNASHFLTISAYVEGEKLWAEVKDISATNIEAIVESVIIIYQEEVEKFRALESHYQESDVDGTRLWADQGLQSKTYYDLRQKITRTLLGRVGAVLKKHEVPYQTSWGVSALLTTIRHEAHQYGWPIMAMWLLADIRQSIKNVFRSYESLRQERLSRYKAQAREQ